MLALFTSLKSLTKIEAVKTDNVAFRLFYKGTVLVHIFLLILLGSKQYFGDPITCDSSGNKDVPRDVINTYCWISGTWTLKEYTNFTGNNTISDAIHVGVGIQKWKRTYTKIYHNYYQWVPTVLFIYSILFYVPRFFWKIFEKGYMKAICNTMINYVSFSQYLFKFSLFTQPLQPHSRYHATSRSQFRAKQRFIFNFPNRSLLN
jgi:hypothetical protein